MTAAATIAWANEDPVPSERTAMITLAYTSCSLSRLSAGRKRTCPGKSTMKTHFHRCRPFLLTIRQFRAGQPSYI